MWTFPYYIPSQLPDWQALERRFSWFADMKDVPQDPEWHAEGDVFTAYQNGVRSPFTVARVSSA